MKKGIISLFSTEITALDKDVLTHPNVGVLVLSRRNFINPEQLRKFIADVHAINPEIIIAMELVGRLIQQFQDRGLFVLPAPSVFASEYAKDSSAGLAFAREHGKKIADELIQFGIDLCFSPDVDSHEKNSADNDVDKTLHRDPNIAERLASEFIEGMQTAGMPCFLREELEVAFGMINLCYAVSNATLLASLNATNSSSNPEAQTKRVALTEKLFRFKNANTSNDYNVIRADYQLVITPDAILFPLYRNLGGVLTKNIRHLIQSPNVTLQVLDFGCGPGTSTPQILKSFNGMPVNIHLVGVDRNLENITAAKTTATNQIEYRHIETNSIPSQEQYYDLIFCFFVLLEQESMEAIITLLTELHRVLKENGRIIIANNHEQLYNDRLDFLYEDNKVPANRDVFDNKRSGARIGLRSVDEQGNAVVFRDFFWTREDYKSAAKAARLDCVDEHTPVGLDTDGKPWKEGDKLGAYHIQVFQKR